MKYRGVRRIATWIYISNEPAADRIQDHYKIAYGPGSSGSENLSPQRGRRQLIQRPACGRNRFVVLNFLFYLLDLRKKDTINTQ